MRDFETRIAALEDEIHALNESEATYHESMKEKKRVVADQIERLRSEMKIALLADTLTDEDKAALRQHLDLPQVTG